MDQQRTGAALFAGTQQNYVLTGAPEGGYDYYSRMMSVPAWLSDDAIPNAMPCLSADEGQSSAWRERLAQFAGERRKIGIVWAGNPEHHLNVYRSAPLAALEPLASVRGVAWFALQKGATEAQLDRLAQRWAICALGQLLVNFDGTAVVIESLDLVITVDTSVAHLAGALGKPVWVMLPKQSDWRWMLNRTDSIWYPTASGIRQHLVSDSTAFPAVEALRLDRCRWLRDECNACARRIAQTFLMRELTSHSTYLIKLGHRKNAPYESSSYEIGCCDTP